MIDVERFAQEVVAKAANHFGIEPPKVRVGCDGCPFYVDGKCALGYIACYNTETKTITFSRPEYITEPVILHELLHHAVASGRSGIYGYPSSAGSAWLAPLGALVTVVAILKARKVF